MAMSAPRSSVFTFESSVHSSHVLHCLDEQRRRDMLCDVTVVVEGQSFRAHRSVLASCSEYFTHKISSISQHGAVITLPQEVTVAGFEPLLKFAYTSKLLFGKDNVVEIRNSASILGFRDLDEACFDFLLPKFFSNKGSAPLLRKVCCTKKCKRRLSKEELGMISDELMLDEKDVKPVDDSPSQQEVAWPCNKSVNSKMECQNSAGTFTPVAEGINDHFMQCPKYRRQLACGKETCVLKKVVKNAVMVGRNDCDLSCLALSRDASSKNETEIETGSTTTNPTRQNKQENDDPWKTEIHDEKKAAGVGEREVDMLKKEINDRHGKWSEKKTNMDMEEDFSDRSSVKPVLSGSSTELGEGSSGLILHHCPPKTFGEGHAITGSLGHERFATAIAEDKKKTDSGVLEPMSIHKKAEELVEGKMTDEEIDPGWLQRGKKGHAGNMEGATPSVNSARERSIVEREVAEHLAKRLGTDVGLSKLNCQDPDAGSSSDSGSGQAQRTSLEWLNFHVNLSSSSTSCPFFQDLHQSKCLWKGAEPSEYEGASQSGVSSLNSGEDGDSETETEGDSESYTRERARQVQLPFSADWIVDLSRNDFQQLLKQQAFTREQLEFVHDMRRRSKNRLAAQRCRKRKLDCIYNLQCEINKLKAEREKLMTEKSQLGQLKLKTYHSVSALCQRVCNEANLQPEQLQVFAKYTSPDCPLSSLIPHLDTLLSQHGVPPLAQASPSVSSVGPDEYMASEEDTDTGDGQR
uniref:transcription regulator protein BACH1-like n=1 Tax=Scatophagus argus TaxID=75038 RepID=UPI001ED82AFD|nr:transcription regulator protein BACH1-like [Scatophagus argus]